MLGRGAYGVVDKMRHRLTDTILAVKVRFFMQTSRFVCVDVLQPSQPIRVMSRLEG